MAIDTIKFKRGVKSKLNNLSYGEPAYISDENELYIGTENGVEKITRNKEVAELSSQLEHKTQICGDDFEGTDLEKLQQAFDYACANKTSIAINRKYNITGGTIKINKPENSQMLYVNGFNVGCIEKNDDGYIFDNVDGGNYTDNIFFSNIEFVNKNYQNSKVNVINFGSVYIDDKPIPKFARIIFNSCMFRYIYKVVYSDTFIQQLRLNNCFIYGGYDHTDYAIEANAFFDTIITNTLFEKRSGGVIQKGKVSPLYDYATGLRIMNCTFERIHDPIKICKSAEGNIIQGCFFEQVTNYPIEFTGNSQGIKIIGCSLNGGSRNGSIENQTLIKWYGNCKNSLSIGNTSYNFPIHNTEDVSEGSVFSIGEDNKYKNIGLKNIEFYNENKCLDTFTCGEHETLNGILTDITFSNRTSTNNNIELTELNKDKKIVIKKPGIYIVQSTFVFYSNPNGNRQLKINNELVSNYQSSQGMFVGNATYIANVVENDYILPIQVLQNSGNNELKLQSFTCKIIRQ